MIKRALRKLLSPLRNVIRTVQMEKFIRNKYEQRKENDNGQLLDIGQLKTRVEQFVMANRYQNSNHQFIYSHSCTQPTLYASAYSCMTLSMLGKLNEFDEQLKRDWVAYFDSFQSKEDGLFYDPIVENEFYADSDWWGARHLAMHMISAYTDLGAKPQHSLRFLQKYYNTAFLKAWLDQFDWRNDAFSYGNDVDNKIMNIGCLLQYQRDVFEDREAGEAVEYIKQYLKERINAETGMWGNYNVSNSKDLSRMVQFAYHLFPIYFYDGDFEFEHGKIVDLVLQTQNKFGGYGVLLNSSSCEDIDSIDILIRFSPYVNERRKVQIDVSLKKAYKWLQLNQVEDGGFVFRLNESMVFGNKALSVNANKGAMLPTWFRTLSLAYLSSYFEVDDGFTITNCPGYEFK